MWCVYLLHCADNSLYCGITNNLAKRLRMHNGEIKGGAKCTRSRRPVRLATCVYVGTKAEALKLEIQTKKKPSNKKIAFLNSFQEQSETITSISKETSIQNIKENFSMNTITLSLPPLQKGALCPLFFTHQVNTTNSIYPINHTTYATCNEFQHALNLQTGTRLYKKSTIKNDSNKNHIIAEDPSFCIHSVQFYPNSSYPVLILQCVSDEFSKKTQAHAKMDTEKNSQTFIFKKQGYSLAVITLSDKGFQGKREDKSGPAIVELMDDMRIQNTQAFTQKSLYILPDEIHALRGLVSSLAYTQGVDCIITTGGTGLSARDTTPDALLPLLQSRLHGFEQIMMTKSLEKTPHAILSRAFAGIIHKSLIIAVPGSVKAAKENIESLLPALPHALAKLTGDTSDCGNN